MRALGSLGYLLYKVAGALKFRKTFHLRNGCRFFFRPIKSDLEVITSVHEGEFNELKTYLGVTNESDLIIDVGGHIGMSAVYFAKTYPLATVVVIEPDFENFKLLKLNVAPYSNVVPLLGALVPQSKSGTLVSLFDRGTGPWGYSIVDPPVTNCRPCGLVPSLSLSSILKQFPMKRLAFIKFDIEGGEKQVLEGDQNVLAEVEVVVAELHDRIVPGCSAAFAKCFGGRKILALGPEKMIAIKSDKT